MSIQLKRARCTLHIVIQHDALNFRRVVGWSAYRLKSEAGSTIEYWPAKPERHGNFPHFQCIWSGAMFSVTWGLKIPSYRSRNCGLNTGHAGSARTPTYLYTVDETSKHHSVDVMRLSVRLLFPKQSPHTTAKEGQIDGGQWWWNICSLVCWWSPTWRRSGLWQFPIVRNVGYFYNMCQWKMTNCNGPYTRLAIPSFVVLCSENPRFICSTFEDLICVCDVSCHTNNIQSI